MCILCNPLTNIFELTILNCFYCPLLASIPAGMTSLTYLDCSACPRLTSIPSGMTSLTTLDCFRCPLLTSIPSGMASLTILNCFKCPLLTYIPSGMTSLTVLYCSGCPLLYIPKRFRALVPWKKSSMNGLMIQVAKNRIIQARFDREMSIVLSSRLWVVGTIIGKYLL